MVVLTETHFFNYSRLLQWLLILLQKQPKLVPCFINFRNQLYTWRLTIHWRFSQPKIINIGSYLLELFENITGVRNFWDTVYKVLLSILASSLVVTEKVEGGFGPPEIFGVGSLCILTTVCVC